MKYKTRILLFVPIFLWKSFVVSQATELKSQNDYTGTEVIENEVNLPKIARFDPGRVAELETQMWRDYYDGQWMNLTAGLLELSQEEFGFSTRDSTRMAMSAGQAAMFFRADAYDPRSLDLLVQFYEIIRKSTELEFPVDRAAELELAWWQKRRLDAAPEEYAADIAALSELVFSLPEGSALPAALIRVEAMEYRDARRNGKMTEGDWAYVQECLEIAYHKLFQTIHDQD